MQKCIHSHISFRITKYVYKSLNVFWHINFALIINSIVCMWLEMFMKEAKRNVHSLFLLRLCFIWNTEDSLIFDIWLLNRIFIHLGPLSFCTHLCCSKATMIILTFMLEAWWGTEMLVQWMEIPRLQYNMSWVYNVSMSRF